MSPAGSSNNSDPNSELTLRPSVAKTFIKGVIGIAVFSVFLNISSNFVNYLIFLCLTLGLLGGLVFIKHLSTFVLGEETIVIKRFLHQANTIAYTDVLDMSIAQGFLAKRFRCGSVYMILKHGRGSVKILGGGTAERLDDVPNPVYIHELISSKLGPFSQYSQ